MAGEIVIVYAYLDTLASSARDVAQLLEESSSALDLSFPHNERVTSAYDGFLGKWDRHRSKLREGVDGAAEALQLVSDTFRQSEDELIAALEGG